MTTWYDLVVEVSLLMMVDDVLCCRMCCLRQYVVLVVPKDEISMHLVGISSRHAVHRQCSCVPGSLLPNTCPPLLASDLTCQSPGLGVRVSGTWANVTQWCNCDACSVASRCALTLPQVVCCPPDDLVRSHHSALRLSSPLRCTCGANGRILRPIRAEMAEIQTI